MTTKNNDYLEAAAMAENNKCEFIDLKFIDLPGIWQHYTLPVSKLTEDLFSEGTGFDGSSVRGFQKIHESDMLLVPDPATAFLDVAHEIPTLSLICDVRDPVTGKRLRPARE